jgi:hypothetical protein
MIAGLPYCTLVEEMRGGNLSRQFNNCYQMMRLLSRTNNAQRIRFARRLSWLVADLIAILIWISEVGHVPDGPSKTQHSL